MSSNALDEIQEIEDTISEAKSIVSKSEGAKETFETQLKEKYELNSLEEAKERTEELDEQIALTDKMLERKLSALKKEHNL